MSLNSLNVNEITSKIQKSCELLSFLNELNYFPYNSCNSLTIYAFKYWPSKRKFLVVTKENNLKEIGFVGINIGHETDTNYLEPVFKVHKLPKVPSNLTRKKKRKKKENKKIRRHSSLMLVQSLMHNCLLQGESLLSSVEIFDIDCFSVLAVSFALVKTKFHIQKSACII